MAVVAPTDTRTHRAPATGPTRPAPEESPTTLTIAMIGDVQTRSGAVGMVALLARLAATDELLVVYGLDGSESVSGVRIVVAGLRRLLPRHAVVTIHVTQHDGCLGRDAELLDDLMDVGSTPIAATRAASMAGVATELCDRMLADRVVVVSPTPVGASLHEIWRRRPEIGARVACPAA
jgi:hypothetical protein